MSDSEEEAAFASADEGDSPSKAALKDSKDDKSSDKKSVRKEAEKEKSPKCPVKGKGDDVSASTSPSSAGSSLGSNPKGNQKQSQQQQRQKKKGKSNQQQRSPTKSQPASGVNVSDDSKQPLLDEPQDKRLTNQIDTDTDTDKGRDNLQGVDKDSQHQTVSDISTKFDSSTKTKTTKTATVDTTDDTSSVSKSKSDPLTEPQPEDIATRSRSLAQEPEPVTQEPKAYSAASESEKVESASRETKQTGSGWGWGGWSSSILSVASNSVQTFTHQIGDGLTTIMDTVESSLDDLVTDDNKTKAGGDAHSSIPDASTDQSKGDEPVGDKSRGMEDKEGGERKEEASSEEKKEEGSSGNWFSGWGISNVAKKVSATGKNLASKGQTLMTDGFDAVENLASGGIDVLETIGKKTYNTFSEHDPAFKKTREYLRSRNEKPNLSSVLKDAKEKAEVEASQQEENDEARKAHFETQFDEFQGIVHLEALEILSNQSEKKVFSLLNSLSSEDHKVVKPVLLDIKQVFELESEMDQSDGKKDQDFSALVNTHLSELKLGTAADKLNKVHGMVKQWMADFELQQSHDTKAIHQQAIQSLAELSSKGVEQFHKAGELLVMQPDSKKDCKERAHSFARLTGVLCHEIGNLAVTFTDCLNKVATNEGGDESSVTKLVTNIYLEASNSTTYLQDAFQLLLPILQQAAIEHMVLSTHS